MIARRCSMALLALLALVALSPAGCIASNVVAPDQRLVAADPTKLAWVPADAAAVDGLFESIDVTGDAAITVRRIWYVFSAGGRYSGAALADIDGALAFQTLSGSWSLVPAGLVLDDQPAVTCEMAPGHLRLAAPNGTVVLRRAVMP